MTIYTNYIVYPEGERQEIPGKLSINELVDLNGHALDLPLPSPRMIVYRVTAIRHHEERGEYDIYHLVELVPAAELAQYCR